MKIETKELDNGNIIINSALAELMRHNGLITARKLWEMRSDPVKNILEERGTGRFFLEPQSGTEYVEAYIKRYTAIPFKERLKSFFSLRFAKYDAFYEWNAIKAFHEKDLPTVEPLAVAKLGKNTCNLTLGITNYKRASELFEGFRPEDRPNRLKLIENIGNYAGKMHAAGFAHQDFYLVHMFVKPQEDFKVYLIDLQRVIMASKISCRYRVKDLGQLLFSASQYVSMTDMLRFWKIYTDLAGKEMYKDRKLIKAIFRKGAQIMDRAERKKSKQNLKDENIDIQPRYCR